MNRVPEKIGDFEILETLGQGSSGIVYRAIRPALRRTVALKIPLPPPDAERGKRFLREAQVMASLSDDANLLACFQVGECDGQVYCAREFVDGPTLEQAVLCRTLVSRDGIAILRDLGRAVQRVHDHGIIHRNLQPSNVLIAKGNIPKLIGFGFARPVEAPQASGASHEIDIRALQWMLCWVCLYWQKAMPPTLEALQQPGSIATASVFADALEKWLQLTESK